MRQRLTIILTFVVIIGALVVINTFSYVKQEKLPDSEIFPNRIRGAAMAVAVSALWIACFVLTYTFPILNAKLGSAGTFWLYAGICVLGFLYIKLRLPETKGRTLEQIERELVD